MVASRALFTLLVIAWCSNQLAECVHVPVKGVNYQVPYNQPNQDGSTNYRIFPDSISVSEEQLQYFFNELNFDDAPGSILVGALDTLYLLSRDLNVESSYQWTTDSASFDSCAAINDNSSFSCGNHIRVYKQFPTFSDLLLVCGTQGDTAQQCRTVELTSGLFGAASSTVQPPNGFLSPYPEYPGFGEFVSRNSSDDRFFSAGFPLSGNQFSLSYFTLNSSAGGLQVDRQFTNDANARWLNYPGTLVDYYRADYAPINQFQQPVVSDAYQFYFVFLREYSTIDSNFDIIYSRVARICRNDPGSSGTGAQGDRFFTTYLKARISCIREVPPGRQFTGTIDYEYNEISSVAFNDDGRFAETEDWQKLMYGAFTGPTIGPPGTAICVYYAGPGTITGGDVIERGIFTIFRSDVLDENEAETPNSFFECESAGRDDGSAQQVQVVRSVAQLVDPLLVLDGIIVTQLVVSPERVCVVRRNGGSCLNQDILFLGTDTGRVLKLVFSTVTGSVTEPIIAEEIMLDDDNAVNRLTIQTADDGTYQLFVSTYSRIYRLPLERCSRHTSCSDCIGSRDPYCVWNTTSLSCERSPFTATGDMTGTVDPQLVQNIHDPETALSEHCQFPTIEFTSSSLTIDEDAAEVNLTISSSTADANGLVEIYTMDGTAIAGVDYNMTTTVVNFDPGQTLTTVTVPLIPNDVYEGSEVKSFTVVLRATGVGGVNIGEVGVVTVTLTENDVVTVEMQSAELTISEGEGLVSVVMVKSGSSLVDTTVLFSTMDQEAIAGEDYLTTDETVTFAPDETTYTVTVPLLNDRVVEREERFTGVVTLPAVSEGVVLGARDAVDITIQDDDYVSVEFSSQFYASTEGRCVGMTVVLSGEAESQLWFELLLTPTTGTADAQDFNTTTLSVTLNSTHSEGRVCVPTYNDATYETSESFSVEMMAVDVLDGQGGSLGVEGRLVVGGVSVTIVTIMDNDTLSIQFQSPSASVAESEGYVDMVIVREGDSQVPVSLLVSVLNPTTANPVEDFYLPSELLLRIEPSEQNVTQRLYIVDDDIYESSKVIVVGVAIPLFYIHPRVVVGSNDVFTLTITDDDATPPPPTTTSVPVVDDTTETPSVLPPGGLGGLEGNIYSSAVDSVTVLVLLLMLVVILALVVVVLVVVLCRSKKKNEKLATLRGANDEVHPSTKDKRPDLSFSKKNTLYRENSNLSSQVLLGLESPSSDISTFSIAEPPSEGPPSLASIAEESTEANPSQPKTIEADFDVSTVL